MACPHAELMFKYAQDAMNYDRPWELWQRLTYGGWVELNNHPRWQEQSTFRRKEINMITKKSQL